MKPLERIAIIDDIGRDLQSRMTFSEITSYFQSYGIPTDHKPSYNSKYVYVKEILPKIEDEIIIKIADELNLKHNFQSKLPIFKDETATFWKTGHFKLFISHLASFRKKIGLLKVELEKFGISSFVAHEDIEPTKEWQDEIEKGLFTMDALCAVLMPGFKESNWTDQEIGVAIGQGKLVIPIRKGIDPYGFIGKYQGYQSENKNIGEVAEAIFLIISSNSKTRNKMINTLADLFLLSNNPAESMLRLKSLLKINNLPNEVVKNLRLRITENLNLKNIDVVTEFNKLMKLYEYENLKLSDFEVQKTSDIDDLPF